MVAIAIGAVAAVSLVVAGIVNRYKLFDYREYMDQTFLINAPITVNIDNIYDQLYVSQDSDDSRATINVNYYDVVDQPEYQFYSTTLSNNVLSISQSDNKPFFFNLGYKEPQIQICHFDVIYAKIYILHIHLVVSPYSLYQYTKRC